MNLPHLLNFLTKLIIIQDLFFFPSMPTEKLINIKTDHITSEFT
jgi:hypothetical protein